MRELTDHQKNFLLDFFFANLNYPGWRSIGTKLLEKGECIVAGDRCIWVGGIGNFIKTEEYEEGFGCLVYRFDLDSFLSSEFFKYVVKDYVKDLQKEVNEKVEYLNHIKILQ